MVEQQQDFSDVKRCEVDVFRDTALRYLGECFIYCNKMVMKNSRPLFLEDYLVLSSDHAKLSTFRSEVRRCCFQIGERLARYSIVQPLII